MSNKHLIIMLLFIQQPQSIFRYIWIKKYFLFLLPTVKLAKNAHYFTIDKKSKLVFEYRGF